MVEMPENFVLKWEEMELTVAQKTIVGRKVFEIIFPDGTPTLFIHLATIATGQRMWMSIPEGRQDSAVTIGAEIIKYYRALQSKANEQ